MVFCGAGVMVAARRFQGFVFVARKITRENFLFHATAQRRNGSGRGGMFFGSFFAENSFGSYPVMKKAIPLLALVLISTIRGLCAEPATVGSDARKFLYEEVLGTVELLDVIKPDAEPLAPGFYKLSREWVGTLTQIEDKQARTKLPPQQPESLRFNCIKVVPHGGEIYLMGAWFDDAGGISGSGYRRFRLTRKPRSAEEILQTHEFDTLKSWFRDAHNHSGGFGSPDEFNWAQGWTFFSRGQNETIVCQSIFAHVSQKQEKKDDGKVVPVGAAKVNNMTYSEGVFRPANPGSEEERRMYPSEYEKHMARLAKENARIDAVPEPLRSLLKARNTPGASDLAAYEAAINRFRDKPVPLLIRQLVERLGGNSNTGSVEMKMLLWNLMDDSAGSAYLKNRVPWKPENKRMAVEALIDSLPEAPGYYVEDVIIIILAETSLVALRMDGPEFSINVRAFPQTPTSDSYGFVSGGFSIKNETARKTILNRIASELRRRWEASGFCVEHYRSTVSEE